MNDDPVDEAKAETKPSGAPTPVQAIGSITKLAIAGIIALIAFIVAAAVFVFSHFKQ